MGTQVGYSSYGGGGGLPRLGALTRWLLILHGALFLGLFLLLRIFSPAVGTAAISWLAFSWEGLRHGRVWQLLTYAFADISLTSLLFNGLALYSFGTSLESGLGRRRYLGLYLSGILGGAVGALIFQSVLSWGKWGEGILFGAQAPILAMVVVYSILYPTARVLFFGLIPMKSRHMAWLLIGLSLFDALEHPAGYRLFPLAHLGGAAAGPLWWLWLRWQRTRSAPNLFGFLKNNKHKFKLIPDENRNDEQNNKEYYH